VMPSKNISVCGTCQEIEAYAKDKTYEIPETKVGEVKGDYHIQKYVERDGEKFVKILCKEKQENFEPCEVNVEDGYICILRAI
ncbi:MAG: hypothetical protein K5917_02640, partial [Clostridiales bacterium]|nr:hypothetical protein [Clostridiales bacterium]